MNKHTLGNWVSGYGLGVTGPKTPSCTGPPEPIPLEKQVGVPMKWTSLPQQKPETLEQRLRRYLSLSDRRPWFERCRCGWNKHGRLSPRQKAIEADLKLEEMSRKNVERLSSAVDLHNVLRVLLSRAEGRDA